MGSRWEAVFLLKISFENVEINLGPSLMKKEDQKSHKKNDSLGFP